MWTASACGCCSPTPPASRTPRGYGAGADWEPFEPTRYEQLVAMMPYQRLHFAPGTRFGYSNPAYIYLARIIEALSGDPWGVYVQKHLWTPLGMTRSYVGATPYHLEADRARGYAWVRGEDGTPRLRNYGRDFDPGVTIPNGGWNAPLDDFAAYARFLLGTPENDAERAHYDALLPRDVLRSMWQPRVPTAGGDGEILPGEHLGLGFFIAPRDGATFVGHTGEQAGYRSFFYLNPATRAAVIGVFNTSDYAHGDAGEARFRALVEDALTLLR
jgi:CubicO group peptidase (beta-lactamase class C family)